jgi:hypothetical protein
MPPPPCSAVRIAERQPGVSRSPTVAAHWTTPICFPPGRQLRYGQAPMRLRTTESLGARFGISVSF